MNARRLGGLPIWLTAVLVTATAVWVGLLSWYHISGARTFLDRFEAPLADMRLLVSGTRDPAPEVVVVAIDDETVTRAGGYPLPRRRLARIVEKIAEAGPRVLAVDILLVDPTRPADDLALAEALGSVPSVIAAAGQFARGGHVTTGVPFTAGELWPAAPMDRFAMTGLVNVASDAAGTPRHLPLLFQTSRGPVPSFALRAAALAGGDVPVFAGDSLRLGNRVVPLDFGGHVPLRMYGPQGSVETIGASALMMGRVPPGHLAGRIVVLGVTATAVADTFSTAFDPQTPGVEVLATGISQLVGGDGLVRSFDIRRLDVAVTAILALFAVFAVCRAPLGLGLVLVATLLCAWLAATGVLFSQGFWFSGVLPLAGVLPPVAVGTLLRSVHDRHAARQIARTEREMRRFQAPALAAEIERDAGYLSDPVEQDAAIVFVDLASFTGVSEALGPAGTRDLLDAFHIRVDTVTEAHEGLVLNFMGDGAMIVFGVPQPRADDAERAVEASFALVKSLSSWIAREGLGERGMSVRLGAHYGPIVLSRLGQEERQQQITATGDSVNVASRLIEVAKSHGANMAMSEELLSRAGGGAPVEPTDTREVEIRGRQQPLDVALWQAPFARRRPPERPREEARAEEMA